jgi:squalene-hopene/tetraprenyl-beta-curcumene cyclase
MRVDSRFVFISLTLALAAAQPRPLSAAEQPAPLPTPRVSFQHEIQRAIDRGWQWLRQNQHSNGWWSTPDHPAVTALALTALQREPSGRARREAAPEIARGYCYLLACAQPDGGIHRSNLVTYNTAHALTALMAAENPAYDAVALRARNFLAGLQRDFGERGRTDTVFDGGIGYGSKYEHSDMGNTLAALEAMHLSRRLVEDQRLANARDLDWAAAIQFLQHCQNLPSHNRQAWVSDAPRDRGGFVYYPGHSMAGGETNAATGRVALRSYGSISYAGLLSYGYANLQRDDPRVAAVFDWLRAHYTLEENPGMGAQGLYYYFHTMAKALSAHGVDELKLKDGRSVNWRRELAMKLIDLQQRDGSWSNDNGRWWEKEPALVTAYAVLTLSMTHRGL